MTILDVLLYPDERLRTISVPVTAFGAETQTDIDNMVATLRVSSNCAGYAAIQMNIPKRIIVINDSYQGASPLILVNPEIIAQRGETHEPEGCMSVPEAYAPVKRAEWVHVKAQNRHGEWFDIETGDFLAKCIQHEIDHLNGILFIDYLSPLKRRRLDVKLKKLKKRMNV